MTQPSWLECNHSLILANHRLKHHSPFHTRLHRVRQNPFQVDSADVVVHGGTLHAAGSDQNSLNFYGNTEFEM